MQVFVTGATGYIGSAVTEALRAAGHTVAGLARSQEAARKLEALGARAHAGDLSDPDTMAAAAKAADGVIHLALPSSPEAGTIDDQAVTTLVEALSGANKPLIYTSGVWVMGDTRGRVAGESSPLRPPALVAWRPSVERRVQDATERKVCGVVIRPAVVYGRGGGMVAAFVRSAREKGVVRFVGDGENNWSFVHIDDLADLYVRALQGSAAGEVYVGADGPAFRVREVAEAASRAGGAEGRVEAWPIQEARKELGPVADALVMDQKIGSTKAGRQLGWHPKGPTVIDELLQGSYAVR